MNNNGSVTAPQIVRKISHLDTLPFDLNVGTMSKYFVSIINLILEDRVIGGRHLKLFLKIN